MHREIRGLQKSCIRGCHNTKENPYKNSVSESQRTKLKCG